MDSVATESARRRPLDIPSKPEEGLAEWTSRIKALQRQVDEDEEAEHRRLEEEIQASRLARLRRSAGHSSASSVELSNSEYGNAIKSGAFSSSDVRISLSDKQHHEDALHKLTGESRSPTTRSQPRTGTPASPMSLAAFIGGKATGPKLTKPAPQQDVRDPTQFDQRTHITAPHPVFGKGGVAMPGMVRGGYTSSFGKDEQADKPINVAAQVNGRDGRMSTPSAVKAFVHKVEQESLASQQTGTPQPWRQRTTSTPTGGVPVHASGRDQSDTSNSSNGVPSRTKSFSAKSHSPTRQGRDIPARGAVTPPPLSKSPSSATLQTPLSVQLTSSNPVKSTITTPCLARSIQPTPRVSLGPQVALSQSTSFQRTPPPKDPTPSISRLQGRGFVRSMVQASSHLSSGSSTTPPLPEKKDPVVKKQPPVLDRWQSTAAASAPISSSPPIASPKPAGLRRARTLDAHGSATEHPPPKPVKPDKTGRSPKPSSSPSLDDTKEPWRSAGLGSASTMISYIKPIKTGDKQLVRSASPRGRGDSSGADELGIRTRSRSREEGGRGGKPLSHLTKDRAKKPRKAHRAGVGAGAGVGASVAVRPAAAEDEGSLYVQHAEAAALPGLVSTARVPELLVAFPTANEADLSDRPSPVREVESPSSIKDKFEDDFVPDVHDIAPEKPPRLTDGPTITPRALSKIDTNGDFKAPSPSSPPSKERPPLSPVRHSRIPSTGNRATVMDVAQAFQERVVTNPEPAPAPTQRPGSEHAATPDEENPRSDVDSAVAKWSHSHGSVRSDADSDKRKSSYERYSAFVLPPLQEENTPVPTPVGTLSRSAVSPSAEEHLTAEVEDEQRHVAELVQGESAHLVPTKFNRVVRTEHVEEPLPEVDIAALLEAPRSASHWNADVQTISIDVMSIIGNTASTIMRDAHVFYETEVLAVIHRAKVKSTGLVSTTVWAWHGKRARVGEREERKLQELARRYGTSLVTVQQYCEPIEFVIILGGQLVTRQGTRAHWSSENTTMHLIRNVNDVTFIDELELDIKNLCSGFSYCLSLLETFYVWHGCGSLEKERHAAREYAKSLAGSASSVIELIEAETDNDEMFWMILGDGEYAKADYWKWRSSAREIDPRVWSVDVLKGTETLSPVAHLADHSAVHELVHVIDCIWEFFVLVGSEARGKRKDIKLALTVAAKMSDMTALSRPFTPTVHVLILPSKIPADLRLSFRDLDEVDLNRGDVPDHMNIIPAKEADEHLRRTTWDRTLIRDPTMLPLGVTSSDLS
ncbi:uncharacterized protein LAESUDRAFT_732262 [Laetiporus sulphureus 93-53]|uniref:DUF7904 domain-containing protein n=1 Tax=Laetiporus sulphureus 93-53 TaxID=1314785 RepID=A0A165B896_9APHY|nr:uncharacterized protein LAESUDRAFT_732262 [Laetiporus sulphureus 93-53]KZT00473.1 hypothetical protein LAESUDRAFT_732262 [Laetiporus sulphureus 93-53]